MHEKRATTRHSFGVEQVVADLVDDQFPRSSAFREIRCIDISQDGIAFFQSHRPACRNLIIGLGIKPNVVYLTARVIHFELLEICGNLVYRVGCQFTGRAQWTEQPDEILRKNESDDAFQFLTRHVSDGA